MGQKHQKDGYKMPALLEHMGWEHRYFDIFFTASQANTSPTPHWISTFQCLAQQLASTYNTCCFRLSFVSGFINPEIYFSDREAEARRYQEFG